MLSLTDKPPDVKVPKRRTAGKLDEAKLDGAEIPETMGSFWSDPRGKYIVAWAPQGLRAQLARTTT